MSQFPGRRVVAIRARLLISVLVALAPAALRAEEGRASDESSPWTVRAWRSDDGLPNNHVTGLAQTADGYLWLATYTAPARFDGMRFEEFGPRQLGLGSNQKFSALALAPDGTLWLGTLHGGVVRLDARGATLFNTGLPYKPVQELIAAADGALWIAHQGGTVARLAGGRVTNFTRAEGVPAADTPNRYAVSFAVDAQGQLWLSKDGQIGVVRAERFCPLLQLSPVNARIAAARAGGVWVASEGGLFHFVEGQPLRALGRFTASTTTEPTALLEDHLGGVWIGTGAAGLFHYDGTRFRPVPTSDARIDRLAEDRKGHLWVGTVGGGLNQIRPRIVTLETEAAGVPGGVVQSLAEEADGTVWATTQGGLLLRRAGGAWQTISAGPKWPGGRASTVAIGADGAVWIGTRDRALHRWKDGAFSSWRRNDGLAGREIHALVPAANGDVWLGLSAPDVVQRWRAGRFETFPMPENIRVIRAMAEDAAGALWIGSSRGLLLRLHGGVLHDETRRTSGEPWSIRCLRATPDGGVWIGYADEGIGWIKDGRYVHLGSAEGFPEGNVSQLVHDDAGWLWCAGDHGIMKVRQSALEALARGDAGRAHFIRYGRSEGLASLEANFGDAPGALRTRDGRLWLPMRTGLAIVDPRQAREDPQPPPVLLQRVWVDDRLAASYGALAPRREGPDLAQPTATLRLPPAHFRLTFEFTALNYRAPENARFRYRLEGFPGGWSEAGSQRSATYSRLPAGDYRFHVQASNSDGVWNEQGAALAFTVRPFMWQTWWFQLAALGAFTGATALVVRRVSHRRVREKLRALERQAAVQRERTRIARDLHDDFGTRLTELGLIVSLDNQAAAPRAAQAELLEHIRALERDLDTIVWTVNPRNDTLDQLVGFICRVSGELLARAGVRCRFDLPEEVPARPVSPELRHGVFLVVREALTNVVKHAQATCVHLRLRVEQEALHGRIEDDGRGFAPELAAPSERHGLRNMRARIEELGGEFHLDSGAAAAGGAAAGTRLVFRVPLHGGRETPPPSPSG